MNISFIITLLFFGFVYIEHQNFLRFKQILIKYKNITLYKSIIIIKKKIKNIIVFYNIIILIN